MTSHTPGPWTWSPGTGDRDTRELHSPDKILMNVAIVDYGGDYWIDVTEADALLIASAPDLLEALQEISTCFSKDPDQDPSDLLKEVEDFARAVIAKATGDDSCA